MVNQHLRYLDLSDHTRRHPQEPSLPSPCNNKTKCQHPKTLERPLYHLQTCFQGQIPNQLLQALSRGGAKYPTPLPHSIRTPLSECYNHPSRQTLSPYTSALTDPRLDPSNKTMVTTPKTPQHSHLHPHDNRLQPTPTTRTTLHSGHTVTSCSPSSNLILHPISSTSN
jgi:hypothetical protein